MGRKFTLEARGRQVFVYDLVGERAKFETTDDESVAVRVEDGATLAEVVDGWVQKGMRPNFGRECRDRKGILRPHLEGIEQRVIALTEDAEARLGDECNWCRRPLDAGWHYCPQCGQRVPRRDEGEGDDDGA